MACERCDLIKEYGQPYSHFPPHSQKCEIIVAQKILIKKQIEQAFLDNATKLKILNNIKNKVPNKNFNDIAHLVGFNPNNTTKNIIKSKKSKKSKKI